MRALNLFDKYITTNNTFPSAPCTWYCILRVCTVDKVQHFPCHLFSFSSRSKSQTLRLFWVSNKAYHNIFLHPPYENPSDWNFFSRRLCLVRLLDEFNAFLQK